MRHAGGDGLLKRVLPAFAGLMRQAGNKIDIDVVDPRLAQAFNVAQRLLPRMQPRDRRGFLIDK